MHTQGSREVMEIIQRVHPYHPNGFVATRQLWAPGGRVHALLMYL